MVRIGKTAILIAPINAQGLHKASEALEVCFGRNIVDALLLMMDMIPKLPVKANAVCGWANWRIKNYAISNYEKSRGHPFFGK